MSVRRVRADEWRAVKELRLRALADPNASVAFLGTTEAAEAETDEFWQLRAAAASPGGPNAQFVFESAGRWHGTATVLVQSAGTPATHTRAIVVGVYVDPSVRGSGAIDALLDACADYARGRGFDRLFLDVHVDNHRAHGAYLRAGFTDTGIRLDTVIGHEREMVRAL